MPLHSIYIISRYGGFMYAREWDAGRPAQAKLGIDAKLILTSSLHSFFSMANSISPAGKCTSGIRSITNNLSSVACLQAPTGVKFVASGGVGDIKILTALLPEVYRLYCTYVVRNTFFIQGQPIHAERFDKALDTLAKAMADK